MINNLASCGFSLRLFDADKVKTQSRVSAILEAGKGKIAAEVSLPPSPPVYLSFSSSISPPYTSSTIFLTIFPPFAPFLPPSLHQYIQAAPSLEALSKECGTICVSLPNEGIGEKVTPSSLLPLPLPPSLLTRFSSLPSPPSLSPSLLP